MPEKLYVDTEGGLLTTHRKMIVEVNKGILRHHNIAIEQVCAYGEKNEGLGLNDRQAGYAGIGYIKSSSK